MNHVIEIGKIEGRYGCRPLGYVGRVLETGEVKYYYFVNEQHSVLREFKLDAIDSIQNKEILNSLQDISSLERPTFSSLLPQDLENNLTGVLDGHLDFNVRNGYPVDRFNLNRVSLSVQPYVVKRLMPREKFAAVYDSLENIIMMDLSKGQWVNLSDEEKKRKINTLIHEVGHMKVNQYFISEDILTIQTGFSLNQYKIVPVFVEGEDVFYRLEGKVAREFHVYEQMLEEVANDFECLKAFPYFKGTYLNFGESLDCLFDGELIKMRYNGIDAFYDQMMAIYPNKDEAVDLLGEMYTAKFGSSRDKNYENAQKIIKKYEKKKRRGY